MSIFEAIMIFLFGVSWPVSIAKALRTKKVEGKSPMFMAIVWCGYASGVVHKVLHSPDWVTALYVLNMLMVSWDLFLYYKYLPRRMASL